MARLACAHCGSALEPGTRFCGTCGQPAAFDAPVPPTALARACAYCGQPLDDDERFCGHCGNAASPAPVSPGDAPEFQSPPSASPTPPAFRAPAAAPQKPANWLPWVGGGLGLVLTCAICLGAVVLLPSFFPDLLDRIPLTGIPVAGSGTRPTATPSATPAPVIVPTTVPSSTSTPTSEPTRTPTPTALPPTSTQMPTGTPAFTLLVQDGFDGNENRWVVDTSSCQYGTVQRALVGGRYRWSVRADRGVVWQSLPGIAPVSDFALAVDGQRQSGPVEEAYGVIFRDDGENHYLFEVSDDQAYRLSLLFADEWTILVDWTEAAAIRPGEVNRLVVVAEGSEFAFFVNDELAGQASDPTLASGQVGLAVVMFNAGDEATFEFDNFELYALEASGASLAAAGASPHTLVLAADRRRPGGEGHPCPSVPGSRGIDPAR